MLQFRSIRARTGALLLLTILALAVGVSACGSSSSTATKRSTSRVVKKEAGLLHVELTVFNMTEHPLDLVLCDESVCTTYKGMENDKSATERSGAYFKPDGHINYPDGSVTYFAAQNPAFGEPFVNVSTDPVGNDGPNVHLFEGESRTIVVGGHHFYVDRQGDTNYKVMRLIACPVEAPKPETLEFRAGCR